MWAGGGGVTAHMPLRVYRGQRMICQLVLSSHLVGPTGSNSGTRFGSRHLHLPSLLFFGCLNVFLLLCHLQFHFRPIPVTSSSCSPTQHGLSPGSIFSHICLPRIQVSKMEPKGWSCSLIHTEPYNKAV